MLHAQRNPKKTLKKWILIVFSRRQFILELSLIAFSYIYMKTRA